MERWKQIREEAYNRGYYDKERDLFEEGADFADEHPNNSWINIEDRLPDEGASVVTLNYYEGKGYNHCVCVFKGGKFVVVFTNLETGDTHDLENKYATHWLPIPKLQQS